MILGKFQNFKTTKHGVFNYTTFAKFTQFLNHAHNSTNYIIKQYSIESKPLKTYKLYPLPYKQYFPSIFIIFLQYSPINRFYLFRCLHKMYQKTLLISHTKKNHTICILCIYGKFISMISFYSQTTNNIPKKYFRFL